MKKKKRGGFGTRNIFKTLEPLIIKGLSAADWWLAGWLAGGTRELNKIKKNHFELASNQDQLFVMEAMEAERKRR